MYISRRSDLGIVNSSQCMHYDRQLRVGGDKDQSCFSSLLKVFVPFSRLSARCYMVKRVDDIYISIYTLDSYLCIYVDIHI